MEKRTKDKKGKGTSELLEVFWGVFLHPLQVCQREAHQQTHLPFHGLLSSLQPGSPSPFSFPLAGLHPYTDAVVSLISKNILFFN